MKRYKLRIFLVGLLLAVAGVVIGAGGNVGNNMTASALLDLFGDAAGPVQNANIRHLISSVDTLSDAQTITGVKTIAGALNGGSGNLIYSPTAPAIGSGFGTSPSVVANNGTAAFTVNVGSGGTANTGILKMPAAKTGYACHVAPNATPQAATLTVATPLTVTSETLTSYVVSTATVTPWTASTVLQVTCFGY